MADFNELLQSLINPGEDGASPTIYDDLSASYTEATSTRDAKITTLSTDFEALQLELLAAKAANWDLMQLIPQSGEVADSSETGDDGENPDDNEVSEDDDFFEDEDDK